MRIIAPILIAALLAAAGLWLWPEPVSPYTFEGQRRLNPEMFDPRPIATWDYPLASDPRR